MPCEHILISSRKRPQLVLGQLKGFDPKKTPVAFENLPAIEKRFKAEQKELEDFAEAHRSTPKRRPGSDRPPHPADTVAADAGAFDAISGNGALQIAERTAIAGVVGGTASALGGGKFANGAYTAAFQHLLNAEGGAQKIAEIGKNIIQSDEIAIDYDGDPRAYAPNRSGLTGHDYLGNATNESDELSSNVILFRDGKPVINEEGYYVSKTSLHLGSSGCQQDYVNGQEVPYIALGSKQISNAVMGDYIMLHNSSNGNYSLAVYADYRGSRNVGIEISPSAARQLGIGFVKKGVTTSQVVTAKLVGKQIYQLAN